MLGGSDAVYHPQDTRSDQGGSSGAPGPLVPTVARGDHGDSGGAQARWSPLLVRLAVLPPWLVPLRLDALSQVGGGSLVRRPPLLRGSCLLVWLPQG